VKVYTGMEYNGIVLPVLGAPLVPSGMFRKQIIRQGRIKLPTKILEIS
jgi:hypothetical protein